MKILFLVPDLTKPGGVANYYNAIRSSLPPEVDYFTRGTRKNSGKIGNLVHFFTDYIRFFFALFRYDIVLINTSFAKSGVVRDAVFCVMCRLLHRPYLIFFRGWEVGYEAAVQRGWQRKLFANSFLRARKILVLSSAFADFIRRCGYGGPVVTETTIVDRKLFESENLSSIVESRRSTTPRMLFLSRLEKNKGIFECIEIHQRLTRMGYPNGLAIAGSGSAETLIKDFNDPDIIRLGYVSGPSKNAAYRDAHFYLFPSTHGEGMPNSVLEAMMFGLPVVTTRVGGIKDFFNDCMGVSTETPDVDAYVNYIVKVLDGQIDPAAIAYNNNEYAMSHFSQDVVAARLLREIYECM